MNDNKRRGATVRPPRGIGAATYYAKHDTGADPRLEPLVKATPPSSSLCGRTATAVSPAGEIETCIGQS